MRYKRMTREEAKGSLIAIKNKYLANYSEDSIINIFIDEYDIQAIDVAIQALEQEPCEDYITHSSYIRSFMDCCRLRDDVMRIIDKYKAESEEV